MQLSAVLVKCCDTHCSEVQWNTVQCIAQHRKVKCHGICSADEACCEALHRAVKCSWVVGLIEVQWSSVAEVLWVQCSEVEWCISVEWSASELQCRALHRAVKRSEILHSVWHCTMQWSAVLVKCCETEYSEIECYPSTVHFYCKKCKMAWVVDFLARKPYCCSWRIQLFF